MSNTSFNNFIENLNFVKNWLNIIFAIEFFFDNDVLYNYRGETHEEI